MNTTGMVMTVTDELLAELEESAKGATPGPWNYDGSYVCTMRQDGETVYVESWNPVADALLSKNAKYIAAANPATITALTAELRRLRAENAELAKDAVVNYLRGLKDQKATFESAYSSTDCWNICESKTSDGLRAMDAAIDTAMASQ